MKFLLLAPGLDNADVNKRTDFVAPAAGLGSQAYLDSAATHSIDAPDVKAIGVEGFYVPGHVQANVAAALLLGFGILCHGYLPITSLAMVDSCMFDVPS